MRIETDEFSGANSAAAQAPYYVVALSFDDADTDITYLTSHLAALDPGSVAAIDRIDDCIMAISGQSQKITPEKAQHTIGAVTFSILDVGGELTTKINAKLTGGEGVRKKRIILYKGHANLTAWADYSKRLTYMVEDIGYKNGVYTISCSDVQRSAKTELFNPHQGALTSTITAAATSIPVTIDNAADQFVLVEHDAIYSANPSDTVGYIKIDDEIICHDGWNGGFTALNVVERGALGTEAVEHIVTATATAEKKRVDEYIFLEMAAPKLIYAILTGDLEGQSPATLPDHWHLAIDTDYVRLADFTGIGLDLWNTATDTGRLARFFDIEPEKGKEFIEKELLLWLGCFMPVYSDGAIGLKRYEGVLPASAWDAVINESDITGYAELKHDQDAVINNISIRWNWLPKLERFSKTSGLIDSTSIGKHGKADLKKLEFKGVFTGVHSDSDIRNYFAELLNRYANPPLRLKLDVLPEWDRVEVGDTVLVNCAHIIDYNSGAALARVFEVQQVRTDWVTGKVQLELFGGIEKSGVAALSDSDVMQNAYYSTGGTELSTVLTISGDAVTANGSLTGAALNTSAEFYYAGNLTINAGVTVTISRNATLRVQGFLTINGDIVVEGNTADAGAIGKTSSGWGAVLRTILTAGPFGGSRSFIERFFPPGVTTGLPSVPVYNLLNEDGTDVQGVPTNLAGMKGAAGANAQARQGTTWSSEAAGGAGGLGGGGLMIVCRGAAFGVNGAMTLDGAAGAAGAAVNGIVGGASVRAQTGGGGFPGGCLILIDGDYSAPAINATTISALRGDSDPPGSVDIVIPDDTDGVRIDSGEEGYGRNIEDSVNYYDACVRVQFIPPPVSGFTWLPDDEQKEINDNPTARTRVYSDFAAGGSDSLTGTFPASDSGELASITVPTRLNSTLKFDWSGIFDETARGGTAGSRLYFLSVTIGGESFTIFSSAHGGIPIPAAAFQFGGSQSSAGEGTGGDVICSIEAVAAPLAAGTATWAFDFSNIQMTVTETMP